MFVARSYKHKYNSAERGLTAAHRKAATWQRILTGTGYCISRSKNLGTFDHNSNLGGYQRTESKQKMRIPKRHSSEHLSDVFTTKKGILYISLQIQLTPD